MFVAFKNEAGEVKDFELDRKSRKRIIVKDEVTWKRVPRPKYKSRATRCANACGDLADIAEQLCDLAQEAKDGVLLKEVQKRVELISIDADVLTELKDEIEQWKEGMEGTNLENSDKYGIIEECLSALESTIYEIESIDISIEIEDKDNNDIADELTTFADEIQSAISDAENAEFPGMYG